jgi:siderophore synthetase component
LASTSIPALEKSVPVNSARAETPHQPILADGVSQHALNSQELISQVLELMLMPITRISTLTVTWKQAPEMDSV